MKLVSGAASVLAVYSTATKALYETLYNMHRDINIT